MKKYLETYRNFFSRTILNIALYLFALMNVLSGAVFGQSAIPTPMPKTKAQIFYGVSTMTDWNTVWSGYRGPAVKAVRAPTPEPTPEYAPFLELAKKAVAEHKEISHGVRCLPQGVPGVDSFVYPAAFVVLPNQLTFVYELDGFRRIRMNAEHPDYVEPSYSGDSVAHWDGDALVIDTVGINTKTVLAGGARHSNQLHVIERMREVQPGIMEIRIWMEDPRAFVKPVEWVVGLQRTPDEHIYEHVCEHNVEMNQIGNTFDAFEVLPEPPQSEVHWAKP